MRALISYLLPIFFLFSFQCLAQGNDESGLAIVAKEDGQKPGTYRFEVTNKPALRQIAGAPEAYYSYFWEFGDGGYSTEEQPVYAYGDTSKVNVNVALTNNYGSGGAPRIKSRPLKINKTSATNHKPPTNSPVLGKKDPVKIFTNHSPRGGDQMVCVISYQNTESAPLSGRLYLFFNEKTFDYANFYFEEARQHRGERFYNGLPSSRVSYNVISAPGEHTLYASTASSGMPDHLPVATGIIPDSGPVAESRRVYNDAVSWEFTALNPGETRNIFVTLKGSDQLVGDTATATSVRAVLVPEFPGRPASDTHNMVIRSSHDPNELRVSDRNINKRTIRKEGITYTIRFQNTGKGPAGAIRIKHAVPQPLDAATIEVVEYYPESAFCIAHDSATRESCLDTLLRNGEMTWHFRNIYLPGTRQPDRENRRATHGWITYRIKPQKRFRRGDIKNRAAIYFDRNDAVMTNRVSTHIRKNYGVALRAGTYDITYGFNGISGSVGLFPFYSKKIYYQPEVGGTYLTYEGRTTVSTGIVVGNDGNGDPLVGDRKITQTYHVAYLDVTPLQARYTLMPWINIGAGLQVSVLMRSKEVILTERSYTTQSFNVPPFPPTEEESEQDVADRFPDKTETGFFVDVQGGFVRNGPSLGIRANYRATNRPDDRRANDLFVQFYLGYKF